VGDGDLEPCDLPRPGDSHRDSEVMEEPREQPGYGVACCCSHGFQFLKDLCLDLGLGVGERAEKGVEGMGWVCAPTGAGDAFVLARVWEAKSKAQCCEMVGCRHGQLPSHGLRMQPSPCVSSRCRQQADYGQVREVS
jgi:hypothetical protein